jgi:hypothetical protein
MPYILSPFLTDTKLLSSKTRLVYGLNGAPYLNKDKSGRWRMYLDGTFVAGSVKCLRHFYCLDSLLIKASKAQN